MEPLQTLDEHELYPIREEDSVPQNPPHFWQTVYLAEALRSRRPDLWITSDTCLYWERGNTSRYVAPDIAVIAAPAPPALPPVYLAWTDPPLLFVGEIGSRSSLRADTGPKVETYERDLRVPEYLYADPPKGDLRLWRSVGDGYRLIPPDAYGRVWSAGLELSFGFDEEGFLRIYDSAGTMLLTHAEAMEQVDRAEQRAETAEQRAEHEIRQRADLERRLAELTAELERLRGG